MPHYLLMKTFQKTDEQIKQQIVNWFALYIRQAADNISGHEQFTLYDKLPYEKRGNLSQYVQSTEQAVLVLTIDESSWIICTTVRFLFIKDGVTEELQYVDFDRHSGFKLVATDSKDGQGTNVKAEGGTADFGLKMVDGQVRYWRIPTGRPGFAFWNLTNKLSIIGRKYIRIANNDGIT